MINILFVDVYYVQEDGGVAGPGFVRVSGGSISHIGVGEPPEEAQLAELVMGGKGRLLYPGFGAALVYPETYVIRDHIQGYIASPGLPRGKILECIRGFTEEEAYYAALMAFYEMSLAGYTRVIAASPHVEPVARALRDTGLSGAVLALGSDTSELEGVLQRLSRIEGGDPVLGVLVDKDQAAMAGSGEEVALVCVVEGNCRIRCGDTIIIPFGCRGDGVVAPVYPFITPSQIMQEYGFNGFASLIEKAHRVVDGEYQALSKGSRAHIAVYDISEPPSWIGPLEHASPYILTPLARVETLISNGRLVVDNSEHLFLGPEKAEAAAEAIRELRRRCSSA